MRLEGAQPLAHPHDVPRNIFPLRNSVEKKIGWISLPLCRHRCDEQFLRDIRVGCETKLVQDQYFLGPQQPGKVSFCFAAHN